MRTNSKVFNLKDLLRDNDNINSSIRDRKKSFLKDYHVDYEGAPNIQDMNFLKSQRDCCPKEEKKIG